MVRHNWAPSVLEDKNLRLTELSKSAAEHSTRRGVLDPENLIGTTLEQQSDRIRLPALWSMFRTSGIMSGDAIAVRFALNFKGVGHITCYEPILDEFGVDGYFAYKCGEVAFPNQKDNSIELFEVIERNQPTEVQIAFEGEFSHLVASTSV